MIWAVVLGGVPWFGNEGLGPALGAGLGGLVSGWSTASLLGWFARFGASGKTMAIAGAVAGVLVASGTVGGLKIAVDLLWAGAVEIDWGALAKFVLGWSAPPAALLGSVTGIYVRARFSRAGPVET